MPRGIYPHKVNPQQLDFLNIAAAETREECLLWPFGHSGDGRPLIGTTMRKTRLAHRLICEMVNGPPPFDSAKAAHNCGNEKCVNGSHVRWDTQKGNLADMAKHGTRPIGEKHGTAKLTEAQIKSIRADSRSLTKIAKAYGVSFPLISLIKNRKVWKHVI